MSASRTPLESKAALHSDRAIWEAIAAEQSRQSSHLELIASENHVSGEVLACMATVLNDKYAEGYPGRRYYGGCEHVDVIERICRDRAKELFDAPHANVQPHSGTQANVAAFMALLDVGDSVLGMSLDHGGHLSHGHPKNFSGLFYEIHSYGVDRESERIDLDALRSQALKVRPRMLLVGASAYPRLIDFGAMADIAQEIGALLMVDMAHIAGLVAAGVHPSPVPHADVVTMTTHKTLRGPRGGLILSGKDHFKKVNSAVFPGDQGGPFMHIIAAKAVALREALSPSFKDYGQAVIKNASHLADALVEGGLRIVSGGTDNHLLLVDVSSVGLTGAQAEDALGSVGITCNKNLIPYDPQPPMKASGIRLGTPAVTSRAMGTAEMERLAKCIVEILRSPTDDGVRADVAGRVAELAEEFPIRPGER